MRWDTFSWFGMRDFDDQTGELVTYADGFTTSDVITVLEAVLIEALEPPVNAKRGDRMGILYRQVIDPEIRENRRRDYFSQLAE